MGGEGVTNAKKVNSYGKELRGKKEQRWGVD